MWLASAFNIFTITLHTFARAESGKPTLKGTECHECVRFKLSCSGYYLQHKNGSHFFFKRRIKKIKSYLISTNDFGTKSII